MGEPVYSITGYENAIHRNIMNNARKTFVRTFPRGAEVCEFLQQVADAGKPGFLNDMARNLFVKFGKLTEKQYLAVCNSIDTWEQRIAERQAAIAEKKGAIVIGRFDWRTSRICV